MRAIKIASLVLINCNARCIRQSLHVVMDSKMIGLYRDLFKGHDRDLSGGGLQPLQQYASYLE